MLTKNKIIKEISSGPDSIVYLIEENKVLKDYSPLIRHQKSLSFEILLKIIKKYHEDTELVKKLLEENPNPFNEEISTSYGICQLYNIILSQGEIHFSEKDKIIYSKGQDYISGKNLADLGVIKAKNIDNIVYIFNIEAADFLSIEYGLIRLGKYINKKLDSGSKTDFTIHPYNIKPRINKESKIVNLYITDLANSLYDNYHFFLQTKTQWSFSNGFSSL